MKRTIFSLAWLCVAAMLTAAEMPPIYVETFDKCIDAEDEDYGYTGGNDNQWGGDIATAVVIYQDSPEWSFTYCNGAYQCLKVGTSKKQGSATTPAIECEGEAVLTFRVAPWEGDSIFYVSLNGTGTTSDPCSFNLKQHKWTEVTIHIADIKGSLKVTFTSTNKHRFFLDDVIVRPADPDAGAIRTAEGSSLDWGLMGKNYSASKRVLHVTGTNLTDAGISLTKQDGEPELFSLASNKLPAEGGDLAIVCQEDAGVGQHGTFLFLRGTDKTTGKLIEKRVMLVFEVTGISLEGAGTRPNPYTCGDVITLANTEGTVWSNTYYWVTGYVLGGVKRYQDKYDGISKEDNLSLVLADDRDETDDDNYVLVQISHDARAALNVVDNPELIGVQIKVEGLLLNDNYSPLYLGKPGVRNVSAKSQYWRPAKDNLDEEDPMNGTNDPDPDTAVEQVDSEMAQRPVFDPSQPYYTLFGVRVQGDGYHGVVIQNGYTFLR